MTIYEFLLKCTDQFLTHNPFGYVYIGSSLVSVLQYSFSFLEILLCAMF